MRTHLILSLLALAPIVATASNLVAVSTLPGFLCGDSQTPQCAHPLPRSMSLSSLPSLLQHLSARTTQPDLPLAETAISPQLVIVITSPKITNPASLVTRISNAVNGASSFHASTDRDASDADLWELSARSMSSVDKLASFGADPEASELREGVPRVATIAAREDDDALFQTLRKLAERTDGKLAILWTTREDAQELPAAPISPPEKEKEVPEDQSATEKTLNAPEINTAQLTGLLVTFLFLIIFIPGFMCLWNIQPPQSFEIFDSNDVKKKMQ